MKNVLIVDDETSFIISLSDGLRAYSKYFNVITAENGRDAVEVLRALQIDLVVTDLKMPIMDGFELLAFISNNFPSVRVIVMTAFGTPEIEARIHNLGAIQYVEKPIDFRELAEKILEGLASSSKGFISGITLPSFLQLIEMEKKTCTLKVRSGSEEGILHIVKGELYDARAGSLQGEGAAHTIVCWENVEIEIDVCRNKKKKIGTTLNHILMEAFRIKDEKGKTAGERRPEYYDLDLTEEEEKTVSSPVSGDSNNPSKKEINIMAVQDKLKEFASLDGFGGVGIFTPVGETLGLLEANGSKTNLKEVGVLANNVLMNAQKASLDMGTGRGQLVHVEAEHAHIIVRCLNEGTDPLKSQPGKAHIHLVLVLTSESSLGLAKLKVSSLIQQLADEVRV